MSLRALARGTRRLLFSSPRRAAAAWAVATALSLGALGGGPGISRDEARVLARTGGAVADAPPVPPLAPAVARASHAAAARAGVGHLRAHRLGTAIAGAVLSALLALAAWSLAGPAGALLAPALLWLAPRHLHAGLVATPDLLLAALFLAAVLAWRRALAAGGAARLRAAALAGGLLGAAILARPDGWVLLPALALHALLLGIVAARAEPRADRPPSARGVAAPLALAAAVAAAVVALAARGALREGAAAWLLPIERDARAAVLALLATPVTLLLAYAGGVAHAALRLARALRRRVVPEAASDDLLFLLAAAAALAGASLAAAPPGARPWLHAVPFLALLASRALLRAAQLAWPARAPALAGALALLVLYPGARAAIAAHPHGTSAWNEAAGGVPGGASRGLPRQDGGDAAAAILAALNERARTGARVWWAGVAPAAVDAYARDGRIRADLARASRPEDADVAVVTPGPTGRDDEYRAWSALRTARPAAGVYLDEVPVALVYARAGAWR